MELEMKEEVVQPAKAANEGQLAQNITVKPVPKPPSHEYMKEDSFKRYLFDPMSIRFSKSKIPTLNRIAERNDAFQEVTMQPLEFLKGLEKDLTLRMQMYRYPFSIMQSMSADFFTKIHYGSTIQNEELEYVFHKKIENNPFATRYFDKPNTVIAREKRRSRIKEQMKKNRVLMMFSGRAEDKVIRVLENPDILKDIAKGDYRNIQMMSPEAMSLLHDPKLLVSILMANEELREKILR